VPRPFPFGRREVYDHLDVAALGRIPLQTRTDASLLVAAAAAVFFGASAIVIAYLWLGEVPSALSVIGGAVALVNSRRS
jgi:drug/metabolite transporter (DMT)-like permease